MDSVPVRETQCYERPMQMAVPLMRFFGSSKPIPLARAQDRSISSRSSGGGCSSRCLSGGAARHRLTERNSTNWLSCVPEDPVGVSSDDMA